MGKRRAHRKSRGGCSECKRRHIKCDEQKPRCLHCVRHNIPCAYRQLSAAASDTLSIENSSPQSDSSWQSIGLDEQSPCFLTPVVKTGNVSQDLFNMSDMALLHHWITVAGHSILKTHEVNHFWHSVMPLVGFKYQYVIHSILSIAALHIAYTNPSERHNSLLVAAEHHSKALDGFAEDIGHAGPENSSALFANATLTFFYAFVSFSKMFEGEYVDRKARTARVLGTEWIPLVRGTGAVLHPLHEYVRTGPLSPLLDLHNFADLDPNDNSYSSEYNDCLTQLRKIWAGEEHAEVYDQTSEELRKCSTWMAQFRITDRFTNTSTWYNRFTSGPFIWLFNAPEKYFVLQHQRQPHALIIFAYYGALLHELDGYWWAEGCGRSIVNAVDECLGPYWSSEIEWPKQAVSL